MDEEKDVYLQVSPPHLSIKSMDIYSIYTYEIHEGDKSLLYKDTGQKAIDRAHDIVENIIKDQLVFIIKKRNDEITLKYTRHRSHQGVTCMVLCNTKEITQYMGHEKKKLDSYPGSYILIDNRPDVCQIAVEKNSAFNTKTDKVVECIASTFNEKLSDYGLRMVVKIKLHAGKFKDIIRDRIVNHQDCVKKVVWEFPNIDRVKGIDAQSAMFKRLNYLHNFAVATNALKGQLVLFGQKGNDMKVYDDSIDDLAAIIALSAQNNYDLTYHFYNSPAVHIKKSSRAVFTIENRIIEDFNDGDMRFDDYGNETFDLICRLDQIRELINDYHNETTIVD